MGQVMERESNIMSALKNAAGSGESKEQLFSLVYDLFKVSKNSQIPHEEDMCVDVLTQMVSYVQDDARARIAERLSLIEDAPRRVIKRLALEPIEISQPVLCQSSVLQDEDLVDIARQCGVEHLEAIAERETIASPVTSELIRLGNVQVWERLAHNNGAELANKSVSFLKSQASENEKIQLGLVVRPDLPQSVVAQLIDEASDSMREQLVKAGRGDLLKHVDAAKAVAEDHVMSSASVLGFEYDSAYEQALLHHKVRPLKNSDIMSAALSNNFPRVCAMFAVVSGLDLEDAVHWLSRCDIDPAIVAFKALGFKKELVMAMLKAGPWRHILSDDMRAEALKTWVGLSEQAAKRIFNERGENISAYQGVA